MLGGFKNSRTVQCE